MVLPLPPRERTFQDFLDSRGPTLEEHVADYEVSKPTRTYNPSLRSTIAGYIAGAVVLASGALGCNPKYNIPSTTQPTLNPPPATAIVEPPEETQVIVPFETPETSPTQEPEKVPLQKYTPTPPIIKKIPTPAESPTPESKYTPPIKDTPIPTPYTPTNTPTPKPTEKPEPTATTIVPSPTPTPTLVVPTIPYLTATPTNTPIPVPETAQTYAFSKGISSDLVSLLSTIYDTDNVLTKYEKNVINSIAANKNLQNTTTIETILRYNPKLVYPALTLEQAQDGISQTLEDTLNAVSIAFKHKPLAERLMLNLEDTEGAWTQQDIRALLRIYPLINPEKIIDFNAINEIMAAENVGYVYSEQRTDIFEGPSSRIRNEDGSPKPIVINYTLNVKRTDVIPTLAHVLWTQHNGQAVVDIQDITEPEHIDGLVSSYWPANPNFSRSSHFHEGLWIGQVIDEHGIISAYTAAKFIRDNPNLETVSGVSKDLEFLYKMTDFMRLTFGHLTGDDRNTPEEMLSRMDKNGFFRGGSPEQAMTAVALARTMGIPAIYDSVDFKATAFFPFSNMGLPANIIYDPHMTDEPVTALLLNLNRVKAMTQPDFIEYTEGFGFSKKSMLELREDKGLYPPYFFPSQN